MNSIRNVKRAIEFEFVRQVTMVESNEWIEMQTRSFNASDGSTFDMRSKEAANDYRYFPEPDLPPVILTDEFIAEAKAEMPALPEELIHRFKTEFGLSEYDANVLADEKEIAHYYLQLISFQKNYKSAANWLMVSIKGYINEKAITIIDFPIQPYKISELIDAIDGGKISNTVASQKIFPALIENPTTNILDLATQLNLLQESDASAIEELVKLALAKFPEKIIEYKNGKTSLQGLFVGEVMKLSRGKAEPKIVNQLVNQYLNN
jgi:aspartyl-tRNA(Asn)/glutamyl-tRNA(Gln) amidotransferase subunit B